MRRAVLTVVGVVAIAAFAGFAVAEPLGARFPAADGRILSMATVIGPGSFAEVGIWSAWDGGDVPTPWTVVILHVLVDTVFISSYTVLLVAAVRGWFAPGSATRRLAGTAVVALLAVEAVEAWVLVVCALRLRAVETDGGAFPVSLGEVLGLVEFVKYPVILIVLGMLAVGGLGLLRRRRQSSSP